MLMRKVGQFVAKMRAMAAEFRVSFDEMARQSELDELRREVDALRSGAPLKDAVGLGEDSETRQVFDDIHAGLREGEAQLHPPMGYQYPASFEPAAPETGSETPLPASSPTPRERRSARRIS